MQEVSIVDVLHRMGACSDSLDWVDDFKNWDLRKSIEHAWETVDVPMWLYWLYHNVELSERTFVLTLCDALEKVCYPDCILGMEDYQFNFYVRKIRTFAIQGYCDNHYLLAEVRLGRSTGEWRGQGCAVLERLLSICNTFSYHGNGYLFTSCYSLLDCICWSHPNRREPDWRDSLIETIKSRVTLEEVIDLYNTKYAGIYPHPRI